MKYRKLGKTGLEVSEIGFGTWGLGGDSYGPVDDDVSQSTLLAAYDAGINFYDTSDLYGNGRSEEVVGDALKGVRDKVLIASKVGLLPHTGFFMPTDFSKEHIRSGIEASLKRLKTDYIDLYQLHSPEMDVLKNQPEVIETMLALKQEGKVRAIGISVRSPQDGITAIKEYGMSVVQVNFNLIDQRAIETGLLDLAASENVGIIARTPLCFGFLTGKLEGNEDFSKLDHRANWPKEQLKRWASAPDLFSYLNQDKDRTPAQLALRFCLDQNAVSTVIPGMLSMDEVKENSQTSDLEPLNAEELERIKLIYQSHSFYDKSAKTVDKK